MGTNKRLTMDSTMVGIDYKSTNTQTDNNIYIYANTHHRDAIGTTVITVAAAIHIIETNNIYSSHSYYRDQQYLLHAGMKHD